MKCFEFRTEYCDLLFTGMTVLSRNQAKP